MIKRRWQQFDASYHAQRDIRKGPGQAAMSNNMHDDDFTVKEIAKNVYLCKENYYKSWNVANIYVIRGSTMDLIVDSGVGLWDLSAFLFKHNLIGDEKRNTKAPGPRCCFYSCCCCLCL